MTRLGRFLRRVADSDELERELDEELRAHLILLEDEAIAGGASPDEARRAARRALGGLEQVKEKVRDERVGAKLESLYRDARIALRTLGRNPLVAVVGITTLALTIGANTAIFSIVDAVLLRPLPYAAPGQLVRLWSVFPDRGNERGTSSLLDFLDWERENQTFLSMAAFPNLSTGGYVYSGGDVPEEIETTFVTKDFFVTLGVDAAVGRTFAEEEHVEGNDRVVVLTYRNWRTRFAGRHDIIGTTLVLSGSPYTVVGVMPPGFEFPRKESEMWAPLSLIPETSVPRERYVRWLDVIARLQPGVSLDAARAEMAGIAARLSDAYPDTNEGLTHVVMRPLHDAIVSGSRTALLIVFGAVGLVLLIGCANIASLLLAQSEKRSREFALRSALGAARGRLVRQALVESGVMTLGGALVGLLIGYLSLPLLRSLSPKVIPRLSEASMNATVLLFGLGLALVAALLVGLFPALRAGRTGHRAALADGTRGSLGDRGGRARRLLVIAQVALVVVLASGAMLLIKSYSRLVAVHPGVQAENLLTMSVEAQQYKYPSSPDITAFYDRLLERVSDVPGVKSAALVRPLPLRFDTFSGETFAFTIVGRPDPLPAERPRAALRFVSPGYFRTMGISLIDGRDFEARDDREAGFVLLANRAAAEAFWPDEDPIGQQISVGGPGATIIGVVENVRQTGLTEAPSPVVYTTHRQTTRVGMTLVVRTRANPLGIAGDVQRAVWDVDPDQPIRNVASMQDVLATSLAEPRFSMGLLGAFAALALLLAAIGIYGVIAYTVSRRAQEYGLRMALGASRGDVIAAVLKQGLQMTTIGIVFGLGGAFVATRWLSSLLFEVRARDPWIFAGVGLLLAVVAFLATLLPARAATRVDPVAALRAQ